MLPGMLKLKPRLTYANVAATIALVLSMSGGALAASHFVITSTKQVSPSVLKALKGKEGARGATGATGPQGTQGPTGPQGPEGKAGTPGEAGSALAYAHITKEGLIDQANTKNFTGAKVEIPKEVIEKKEEGIYCISGLNFTPHNVVATVDTRESFVSPGVTATLGPFGKCSSKATQITVETFETEEFESHVEEFFVNLGVFLQVN
jgi:hypothetical protein